MSWSPDLLSYYLYNPQRLEIALNNQSINH